MSFATEWRRPDLSAFEVTDHERAVANGFTRILLLQNDEDSPQEYPVQLAIGVQFFTIGIRETPAEADWLCWQLAKALSRMMISAVGAYVAEIDRLNLLVEECREQRDKARNDAIETVQAEIAGLRRKLAQKNGE